MFENTIYDNTTRNGFTTHHRISPHEDHSNNENPIKIHLVHVFCANSCSLPLTTQPALSPICIASTHRALSSSTQRVARRVPQFPRSDCSAVRYDTTEQCWNRLRTVGFLRDSVAPQTDSVQVYSGVSVCDGVRI